MALFVRRQSHIGKREQLIELNESLNSLEQIIKTESEKSSPRDIDRYVSLQFEHLRLRYEINSLTIQSIADSGDDSPTTFSDEDSDPLHDANRKTKEEDSSSDNDSDEDSVSGGLPIKFLDGSVERRFGDSLKCLSPDVVQHDGLPVDICTDIATTDRVINEILEENGNDSFVVGLDCEWTPGAVLYDDYG